MFSAVQLRGTTQLHSSRIREGRTRPSGSHGDPARTRALEARPACCPCSWPLLSLPPACSLQQQRPCLLQLMAAWACSTLNMQLQGRLQGRLLLNSSAPLSLIQSASSSLVPWGATPTGEAIRCLHACLPPSLWFPLLRGTQNPAGMHGQLAGKGKEASIGFVPWQVLGCAAGVPLTSSPLLPKSLSRIATTSQDAQRHFDQGLVQVGAGDQALNCRACGCFTTYLPA